MVKTKLIVYLVTSFFSLFRLAKPWSYFRSEADMLGLGVTQRMAS